MWMWISGPSNMKPMLHLICAAALLVGCGGNPFLTGVDDGLPADISGTGDSAKSPIKRSEKKDAASGNGYATGIKIEDPDPDTEGDETFFVDGLAFDGDNVYARGGAVADLGPFQVYEGDVAVLDPDTGVEIPQDLYRAVYGKSTSGRTSFAIVRTGSYANYGFGGFVYERNGRVTLPTTGQATYSGDYAGLRDFTGRGGLEYVSGTMTMAVDFRDFNEGQGVTGTVSGRTIFDMDGADITDQVIAALNDELDLEPDPVTGDTVDTELEALPVLNFAVGPGVLKASGELDGTVGSRYIKSGGATPFETGTFYAVMADTATATSQEVVGIIRVTATDLRYDGVTVRETGGFILYHQ
jgi:hypothetical protein